MSSPVPNDQERLRLEIQNFFDKASTFANDPQFCRSCGRRVKFLDATFILYGTSSTWKLRVPVCDCKD